VVSADPAQQDAATLIAAAKAAPILDGRDLVAGVTCKEPYAWSEGIWTGVDGQVPRAARPDPKLKLVAFDYGVKRNILRLLASHGLDVTVFPAETPATSIAHGGFDGVFISNGPGDPAATGYGVAAVRGLLGKVPIFGICLGNQLLGLALGGATYKMRFGHRGVNQPVKDLATGRVEITSHNHGFAVDPASWARDGEGMALTDYGRVHLSHWNLNDDTLEGMRCLDVPAFSVQYHPEAAPGPHDSRYLVEEFRTMLDGA